MTASEIAPRARSFIGLARDMAWLFFMFTPILLSSALGVYVLNREVIVTTVKAELGIGELATRESVASLSADVRALTDAVNRAAGEDRVIRQPQGLSYVSEPVHVGEIVILNLVIERTELGLDCKLLTRQPLFTDTAGITTAGTSETPIRQVGKGPTRLRVEIEAPDNLAPGRVELYLVLEYDCNGRRVYDRTDTVTYELLP